MRDLSVIQSREPLLVRGRAHAKSRVTPRGRGCVCVRSSAQDITSKVGLQLHGGVIRPAPLLLCFPHGTGNNTSGGILCVLSLSGASWEAARLR
jgi:hypothetical protein